MNIPSQKIPYIIEIPVMLIMSIIPLYLFINRYQVNYLNNFKDIIKGNSSVSSGVGATFLGYLFAFFMAFLWIAKIYYDIY